jgi:S1-C subfamily serine protease
MELTKKLTRIVMIVFVIACIGGIGGIFLEKVFLPKFVDAPWMNRFAFLRKASENTTIINKTEEVVLKEDDSVEKIASQSATAVVKIVSVSHAVKVAPTFLASNTARVAAETQPVFLSGSGVLVTNDGLLVTSRKTLIEKDADYTVILFNGQSYKADLVGIDNFTNLAYLKIPVANLPAVSFANSDDMRSGKKLIAIASGNQPSQNQFSSVMINSLNQVFNLSEKTVASSEKLEGVFAIDFPHEEDYLGGIVINYNGEMIGSIAYTEIDSTKHYFVIPSNAMRDSLDIIVLNQVNERAVLGLYYLPITKELSVAYHLDTDAGAWVYSPSGKTGLTVIAGSPADKAKFTKNDIITTVNGQKISLEYPLSSAIARLRKGDTADITVLRNHQEIRMQVNL